MFKTTSSKVVHRPPQHKVFINFRGTELRGKFVSHLESALKREGINAFTDNQERSGKPLNTFFEHIKESRIAIAVISSLYTESKWCLNELAAIHDCVQEGTLEVFPVFYKVKVRTVKNRTEEFGKNFERLLEKDDCNREKWQRALEFVTGIKGERVNETSDEVQVINKIVNDVKIKLEEISMNQETKSPREKLPQLSEKKLGGEPERSSSSKACPLFGIETRLEQLKEKLDLESDKVTQIVGVVGMPGIGKTTLAKKLMDDCGHKFYHTMFLDDVREKSRSLALHRLKLDLLLGLKESQSDGNEQGDPNPTVDSLKAEFNESKVLIVLDDVSEREQIEGILGRCEWFREGSRVVITTSSMSAVKGMVDETYLVPGLSDNDALKYFEKHAFAVSCEPSYMNLARKVVDYSRGHPLALRLLGVELFRKDEAYWKSKVETLAKSPISNSIQNFLKTPYDNLDKPLKDLFLDVACLFRFEDEYLVRSLLDSSPHENVSEIRELTDKFLINICGGRLEINDMMYTLAMGLESSSSSERRLINHGEIIATLRNKAEATKVRGIFLDMSEVKKMSLGIDTFKEMNNLRYLKLYNSSCPRECEADSNLNFPNGLKFRLPKIRYLHWLKFPLKSLPQDFEPGNLIDLKLPYSHIEQLWEGEKETSKLKWLDLNHSSKLRTLSGLSMAQKLQSMNLEGCTGLKTIHQELQNMENLVFLNLRGCTSLESLSQMNLISLKTLILSGCSNLEEFNLVLENIEELYLDGTAIKGLPSKIGNLQRLVLLTLKDCKRLSSLPKSIENLKALQKLVLSGCSSLASFPEIKEDLKHLKTLLIDGTTIKELPRLLHRFSVNQGQSYPREWPQEIYKLSSVQRLSLSKNNIRNLPNNMSYLYNLKWLDLKYCEQLKSLPMLPPNLHWLDAHGCISLENIESPLAFIEAATEHPHCTFNFTNCAKLDQVAKNQIVSYVRKKIQLMSDPLTHQAKGSILNALIGVCYPSWQLPVWFSHRTVGSELKQKLPRHWNEDGLTGIALCAVVSFEDYRAESSRLLVSCTSEMKERDEPLVQFSCILGGWTEHGSDRPREIIKSYGHVFIGYTSLSEIKKLDAGAGCVDTEASFMFQVTDGTKRITNCKVIKCGFTLIYEPTKHVHFKIPSEATSVSYVPLVAIESGIDISGGANFVSSLPLVAIENGRNIPDREKYVLYVPLVAIENGIDKPSGAKYVSSTPLVAIENDNDIPHGANLVSSVPLVATENDSDISRGANHVSSVPLVATENGSDIPRGANHVFSVPLVATENGSDIPRGANHVSSAENGSDIPRGANHVSSVLLVATENDSDIPRAANHVSSAENGSDIPRGANHVSSVLLVATENDSDIPWWIKLCTICSRGRYRE